jgi:hypothetical protein
MHQKSDAPEIKLSGAFILGFAGNPLSSISWEAAVVSSLRMAFMNGVRRESERFLCGFI